MGVHLESIQRYAPSKMVDPNMEFGDNYSWYQIPFAMERDLAPTNGSWLETG